MATTINTTAAWTANVTEKKENFLTRFFAFAAGQKQNRTLWFFITLMVHGVLVLPVPAVLVYYLDAPVWVLGVTMICFFANLIANMGGEGIKVTLSFLFSSILIHVLMILLFIF